MKVLVLSFLVMQVGLKRGIELFLVVELLDNVQRKETRSKHYAVALIKTQHNNNVKKMRGQN